MAIVNEIGNYLKVDEVNKDVIKFSIYKNKNVRNNLTDFDIVKTGEEECTDSYLDSTPDNSKTLRNNMITFGYQMLKMNPLYSGWTDLV